MNATRAVGRVCLSAPRGCNRSISTARWDSASYPEQLARLRHLAPDRLGPTRHFGPAFLEKGRTQFRATATKSKVTENDFTGGKGYMKIGAKFDLKNRTARPIVQRRPFGA